MGLIRVGVAISSTTVVNLRSGPGLGYDIVGRLNMTDDPLSIIGGPVNADGMVWWNIDDHGKSAWLAEMANGKRLIVPAYDRFDRCMAFVFDAEAGFSNDRFDNGGVTKYGISKAAYPNLDIANLTREQAEAIYHTDYWVPSGASGELWPLCLVVVDTAILHGVGQARRWLAASGGSVWVYLALRLASYASMDTWHYHGAGWCNRVARLMKVCAG